MHSGALGRMVAALKRQLVTGSALDAYVEMDLVARRKKGRDTVPTPPRAVTTRRPKPAAAERILQPLERTSEHGHTLLKVNEGEPSRSRADWML